MWFWSPVTLRVGLSWSTQPRAHSDRRRALRVDSCCSAFLGFRSEEFPGEVEAEIETVRKTATGELSECRPLAVVEVELKDVTARDLLDGEPVGSLIGTVAAGTRSHFADDIHRGAHSHAAADAHEECVAINVQERSR